MVPVSAASLRASFGWLFPFLLGGTFIEAISRRAALEPGGARFPFLLGGTFIEADEIPAYRSFEGGISLPFGRDFH